MGLQCQAHRMMPRASIERFQEWVYQTDHPIEALLGQNYFRNVSDRLLTGDIVEAYSIGATRALNMRFLVSHSDRQSVRVTPFVPSCEVDGCPIQEARFEHPSKNSELSN